MNIFAELMYLMKLIETYSHALHEDFKEGVPNSKFTINRRIEFSQQYKKCAELLREQLDLAEFSNFFDQLWYVYSPSTFGEMDSIYQYQLPDINNLENDLNTEIIRWIIVNGQ